VKAGDGNFESPMKFWITKNRKPLVPIGQIETADMLGRAEDVYRKIASIVPAECDRIEHLDEDNNKRIIFNRSPNWISLYYLKHERAPKLKEGYWIRDENGAFRAEIFQGTGPDRKSIWESVENHPEQSKSFENILNWGLSVIPEEAAKFLAQHNIEIEKRKKCPVELTRGLRKLDFQDLRDLLELIVPPSLAQDTAFWSKLAEDFYNPESYRDDTIKTYRMEEFFDFAMRALVRRRSAAWTDWKDTETWDSMVEGMLESYSLPAPTGLFATSDDIAKRIQKLAGFLRESQYRIAEVDRESDDYLIFLVRAEEEQGLNRALARLKKIKLMPEQYKLKPVTD